VVIVVGYEELMMTQTSAVLLAWAFVHRGPGALPYTLCYCQPVVASLMYERSAAAQDGAGWRLVVCGLWYTGSE